jgi:hypothetical protein
VQHSGAHIIKQFGYLLFLNTLINFPKAQASLLLTQGILHTYSMLRKEFVHLSVADSRSSISNSISTCAGYLFALGSNFPDSEAASGMVMWHAFTFVWDMLYG